MNDRNILWPAYKFGMSPDDVKTTLHRKYNTIVMPVLDIEAFSYDVSEISNEADTIEEFHALLAERKKKRVLELREALELMMSEISYNDHLLPRSSMDSALTVFRDRSFDAMVRFCSTFIPKDVLNNLNSPPQDEQEVEMPEFSEDYWGLSDDDDDSFPEPHHPSETESAERDGPDFEDPPLTLCHAIEQESPFSPSQDIEHASSDTDFDNSSVSDFDTLSNTGNDALYCLSQDNFGTMATCTFIDQDYHLDEHCHFKYTDETMSFHSKTSGHELSHSMLEDASNALQSSLKEKTKLSSQKHSRASKTDRSCHQTRSERSSSRCTSPSPRVMGGRVNKQVKVK